MAVVRPSLANVRTGEIAPISLDMKYGSKRRAGSSGLRSHVILVSAATENGFRACRKYDVHKDIYFGSKSVGSIACYKLEFRTLLNADKDV